MANKIAILFIVLVLLRGVTGFGALGRVLLPARSR
jgi:hypothetical protein